LPASPIPGFDGYADASPSIRAIRMTSLVICRLYRKYGLKEGRINGAAY
jgi:hypothetical protein